MNNIINSSGIYDISSYNSISNNATILSTFHVSGLTQLNNTKRFIAPNRQSMCGLLKLFFYYTRAAAIIVVAKFKRARPPSLQGTP
jgi:hypothetical protein